MDKKMKLAFACLSLLILTATLAYAYQFSMQISWTKESTKIGVYQEDKETPWVSPYNFVVSDYPNTTMISFWIKNEGTVAVDVKNSTIEYVNCTATWNPTAITNLLVDNGAWLNLTLTITGDGYYNFDFNSTKHLG